MSVNSAHSGPTLGVADRVFSAGEYVEIFALRDDFFSVEPEMHDLLHPPGFSYTSYVAAAYASSKDGRYIGMARKGGTSGYQRPIQIADLHTGTIYDPVTVGLWGSGIDFSPDGELIAFSILNADDTLRIHKVGSWERVFSETTFPRTTFSDPATIVFSPDGTKLGIASFTSATYPNSGGLWYVDINTMQVETSDITLVNQDHNFHHCVFSPDGTKLGFARSYSGIGLGASWVTGPGTLPAQITDISPGAATKNCYGCDFSPDGNLFAVAHAQISGRGGLSIYDVNTLDFITDNPNIPGNFLGGCKFTADGNYLLAAQSTDLKVLVIDTTSWTVVDEIAKNTTVDYKLYKLTTPFYRSITGRTFDSTGSTGVPATVGIYDRDTSTFIEIVESTRSTGYASHLLPRRANIGAIATSDFSGNKYTSFKGRV